MDLLLMQKWTAVVKYEAQCFLICLVIATVFCLIFLHIEAVEQFRLYAFHKVNILFFAFI